MLATLAPLSLPATVALQQGKDLRPPVLSSAGFSRSSRAAELVSGSPSQPPRACDKSLPPHERLMVTSFVESGFHGSTALEQALLSAPHVGSLCLGGNWECEAKASEDRCDTCMSFDRPANRPRCLACETMRKVSQRNEVSNASDAYNVNLQLFEPIWDQQPDKPVLAVKWAPIWAGTDQIAVHQQPFDRDTLERAVTPGLAAKGVERVRWAVILNHRPWCMWNISSHAREERGKDLDEWARKELEDIERLVSLHKWLHEQNVPVILTSLAQMFWRPHEFVKQVSVLATSPRRAFRPPQRPLSRSLCALTLRPAFRGCRWNHSCHARGHWT